MRTLVLCLVLVGCRVEGPDASPAPPVAASDTARADAARVDTAEGVGADPISVSSPVLAAAGLVVPVAGIQPGNLVDTFEAARSEGRVHNAIDILAPRGTPVYAATRGTVVRLFESDKGGLTVYQTDADTSGPGVRVYYYAHLDAYAAGVAEGQRIEAGDAIGTVGDSGNAAPGNTHLHFAIWDAPSADDFWDGEPVNPYPLLAR